MLTKRDLLQSAALSAIATTSATPEAFAQALTGAPAAPELKYSTPMPPGVAAPNKVESRLGTLNFFDGFPDNATAEKLYDNLDFQRAVQAFLLAIPAASVAAYRDAMRTLGPVNTVVPIWEQLLDARLIGLTGNDNTVYSAPCIDLSKGPLVFEIPPKVLGFVNDVWEGWVVDVGFTGPDKGEGGQYLFLPPGYQGAVPDDYHVVRSPTFSLFFFWRSFLTGNDPAPGVELVKKSTKIYPLGGSPTAPNFVNLSGKPFNTVTRVDYRFWEQLNEIVQQEPSTSLDQIRLGYYASVGIQKGKPFAPDERMKRILTEAAAVGDATARTLVFHNRHKDAYCYPNSMWQLLWMGGYRFQTEPDVLNLDAYIYYSFFGLGVSPRRGSD
jgi:hypothetical protein